MFTKIYTKQTKKSYEADIKIDINLASADIILGVIWFMQADGDYVIPSAENADKSVFTIFTGKANQTSDKIKIWLEESKKKGATHIVFTEHISW